MKYLFPILSNPNMKACFIVEKPSYCSSFLSFLFICKDYIANGSRCILLTFEMLELLLLSEMLYSDHCCNKTKQKKTYVERNHLCLLQMFNQFYNVTLLSIKRFEHHKP